MDAPAIGSRRGPQNVAVAGLEAKAAKAPHHARNPKGCAMASTPVVPPHACADMVSLRAQIDRLDRALVALMAERQGYIERAAQIKTDRGVVHDDARIEDVVAKVLAEAKRAGLSAAIAEPVWRTMIARCIAHEFEMFDAKNSVA
jgi:isochorismate pyruvate lyase